MIVTFLFFYPDSIVKRLALKRYRRYINIIIRLNLAGYMYKIISLSFLINNLYLLNFLKLIVYNI